jgi:hypothetical protein
MAVDIGAALRRKRPVRLGRYGVRLQANRIGFVAWNGQRAQGYLLYGESLSGTFPSFRPRARGKLRCDHGRCQR